MTQTPYTSAEAVERFDPDLDHMVPEHFGNWVRYSDYDALSDRLATAEADLDTALKREAARLDDLDKVNAAWCERVALLEKAVAAAEAETAKIRSALDRIEYTAEHATPITADYIQNNDVLPDWLSGDTPLVPVELLAKAEAKRDAALQECVKLGLEWAASVCDRAPSKQNQTGGNLEAESAHWCAAAIRTAAADPARVAQIAKGEGDE